MFRTGIGQDSHRFLTDGSSKPCKLGGLIFEDVPGLSSDSDGDVVLHAICNAITSLSGVQILGGLAQDLNDKEGITDSEVYLKKALETLHRFTLQHVALSIEAIKPRLQHRIEEMREKIASLLNLNLDQVGITATTGQGLSEVGLGEGVECLCIITVSTLIYKNLVIGLRQSPGIEIVGEGGSIEGIQPPLSDNSIAGAFTQLQ